MRRPRRHLLPILLLCLSVAALPACTSDTPPPNGEDPPPAGNGEEEEPECTEHDDCGDGDPCTIGRCVAGACNYSRVDATPTILGTVQPAAPALSVHLQGERWLHIALGEGGVETWDLRPLPDEPATLHRHRVTTGPAEGLNYFRSHLFVVSGVTGIEVFPGDEDEAISLYRTVGDVRSVMRVDDLVVASVGSKGLEIIDYEDLANPRRYSRVDTLGRAERTVRQGSTLYVADGLGGVAEIDFRERDDPRLRGERRIDTEGRVMAVTRRNNLLILAEWGVGMGIFDLERRGEEDRAAVATVGGPARALRTLSPHTALIAAEAGGLVILDLIDPTTPRFLERITFDGPALDLDRSSQRVAVALGDAGVAVVDLGCDSE